jgi:Bacterial low temperature requirement A protein (LtrA)
LLSHDPTWRGLVRAVLVLGALWWGWAAYAWLTNTLDPEEGAVRLAMFAAIGEMLVVSLPVPDVFGATGVIFGVAYLVVRVLNVVLYAIAGRGDRDLFRAIMRIAPVATTAPVLPLAAGFLEGPGQIGLWIVALAIDYLSVLLGRMRGWRVSPEHVVERFGLIIIIALGESIVAIGVGASGLPLDAGVITAALLGVTVAACLWWSYFDWVVYVAEATLVEATGVQRARFARDAYSYLHLPMVAGIVLFAFGAEDDARRRRRLARDRPRARSVRRGRPVLPRPRGSPDPHRRRYRSRSARHGDLPARPDPGGDRGPGDRRPRARRSRLRGADRVRSAPVPRCPRLDPRAPRDVHDRGGAPGLSEPREAPPSRGMIRVVDPPQVRCVGRIPA